MPLDLLKRKFRATNGPSDVSQTPTSADGRSGAQSPTSSGSQLATASYRTNDSWPNGIPALNVDEESKYKAITKYLHGKLVTNRWLPEHSKAPSQRFGLLLRRSQGTYICEPEEVDPMLLKVMEKINAAVAFTMSTETSDIILDNLQPHQNELLLPNGHLLQVIPSLSDLASSPASSVKRFQYAALIQEERLVLVWHDKPGEILNHAAAVEEKLVSLVCGTIGPVLVAPALNYAEPPSSVMSPAASTLQLNTAAKEAFHTAHEVGTGFDEEALKPIDSLDRPIALTSAIYVGVALCMIIFLLVGIGVSRVLYEILVDGEYTRLALLATIPVFLFFSIFFMIVVFGNLFQAFGPTKNIATNTRYHSAIYPDLKAAYAAGFSPPHITIQMPIYTESLNGVIIPTLTSLKAAISHYESHGGTANVFINDDGFAYMSRDEQEERRKFYYNNNISWVARPKNSSENGYIRKGKFKKASNMNFALSASARVERRLIESLAETLEKSDLVDPVEEEHLYRQALEEFLASNSEANAGGDIRIGEFILLVDSDTRVPVDCLLHGAAEMFLSPEVAIVQHSTAVMQVVWDYFENGITFFTNLIYTAIRFAVGSGETAPFVGHNAFLRWKAIQSVGHSEEGYTAFWSESHVSEDFAVALRLQIEGNIVRLASYHGDGFKEGVSLTIYDELARWEKYAYGCNEMVFNPILTWLWRGPFSKLFMSFLWCNLQLSSKITILGYVSTYYALASAFPMTLVNYFIVGWYNPFLDKYYMNSWQVFLGLIVVFSLLGNVCLAVIRYRLGQKSLLAALIENFKWMPLMAVFFGGLSFHLSLAILAHMFQINISWSTTAKEKEDSNFFKEVPKILKRFKWLYAIMVPIIGGMIYLGCFAPHGWRISGVISVVPLSVTVASHILLPLLLNPSLMVFNY